VDGDKDLIIHAEYERGRKALLVASASKFDALMYLQIVRLNKQVKIIKEMLEVSNEK
tara:strand:- start:264 stop:434 length:171 start_codon:yes stop_codon:yes gene_type:complete